MNKARIIYIQDPDGNQPALDMILTIAQNAATGDNLYIRLLQLIRLGINDIEKRGVIKWELFGEYKFVTTEPQGYQVTLNLVKRLEYNQPLFEFRVNHRRFPTDPRENGYAFRMIFFTYYEEGVQYILCTHALIKRSRSSKEFNEMILKALEIHSDFIDNPSKYLKAGDL